MWNNNEHCEVGEIKVSDALLPHIKKKYFVILLFLGICALLVPSYLGGVYLIGSYVCIGIIATLIVWLYTDYRFQKHHRKCRPFVIAGMSQKIAVVWLIATLLVSIPLAYQSGEWIPYLVYWLLIGAVVLNHYQIFALAKQHKHKYPDRCEFC